MAESVNSAVSNLNHGGLVALVGMVPVESAFCAPPAGPGERAARGPELNGTERNGTELASYMRSRAEQEQGTRNPRRALEARGG